MSKKTRFTMTQKEAQLVVDGIVQWEEGRRSSVESCILCLEFRDCCDCPVTRYMGQSCPAGDFYFYDANHNIALGKRMLEAAGFGIAEVTAK